MSFTAGERISVSKILGWTKVDFDVHLITNAAVIDSDIETAVRALLTEYDALPADDGVEVFPNAQNYGARVKNARTVAENRIKSSLYSLLNITDEAMVTYMDRG